MPVPTDSFTRTETFTVAATTLASSMAILDGTALNVALPVLQKSLNATAGQLLWVLNAYTLPLAALILLGGALGDRYGRKRIFMLGIAGFLLFSLACGLSPTINWLIAGRAAQGVLGALMVPGSLAIITATVAPQRMGRAIGTWSAALAIMVVGGPALGGLLADVGWWRGVFFINLPVGLTTLALVASFVPESKDEAVVGTRLDVGGAALVTIGLGMLTFALTALGDGSLSRIAALALLAAGLSCMALFLRLQRRLAHPLLPLSLFNNPTFSGANLLTLFLYGALTVVTVFLPLNLIQVQGYSSTWAGLATLGFPLPLILLSRLAGSMVDRLGYRRPMTLGPIIVAISLIWLAFTGQTRGPADYWLHFLPGLLLFGLGMAITVVPLTSAVMSAAPAHLAGTASGINNAVTRTAGVLALAALGGLAIAYFTARLMANPVVQTLPGPLQQSLHTAAKNLAGLKIQPAWQAAAQGSLAQAVKDAFLSAYQALMLVCAGLALASSAAAAWLIQDKKPAASATT